MRVANALGGEEQAEVDPAGAVTLATNAIRAEAESFYLAIAPSLADWWPESAFDLETLREPSQKPIIVPVTSERPNDPYAEPLVSHLRSLGLEVAAESAGNKDHRQRIYVDIEDRRGRSPNRRRGVLEIHQLVRLLGLDRFAHIRADSIAQTVAHFPALLDVASRMDDDLSTRTAYALLTDQLSGLPRLLPPLSLDYGQQYFGTGLFPLSDHERIADVGAAHGDSFVKFTSRVRGFDRYVAFEPDPAFHSDLRAALDSHPLSERTSLDAHPVVRQPGPVTLDVLPASGNTRVVETPHSDPRMTNWPGAEAVFVEATSLDAAFSDEPLTIVKMDIEGGEAEALRGGVGVIGRDRPKLLLSVYHEVNDLIEIPQVVHSIDPSYKLFLRNHTWATDGESWPGALFCETVLYAL
jgi:FkbM family methyltransferase